MTYEAVVTERNVLADEGVRLNFCSFAYNTSFLYLYKGANKHVIA